MTEIENIIAMMKAKLLDKPDCDRIVSGLYFRRFCTYMGFLVENMEDSPETVVELAGNIALLLCEICAIEGILPDPVPREVSEADWDDVSTLVMWIGNLATTHSLYYAMGRPVEENLSAKQEYLNDVKECMGFLFFALNGIVQEESEFDIETLCMELIKNVP